MPRVRRRYKMMPEKNSGSERVRNHRQGSAAAWWEHATLWVTAITYRSRDRSRTLTTRAETIQTKPVQIRPAPKERTCERMADIPKAEYEGELKIGNAVLKTFVLDDGRRIIEKEGLENFFRMMEDGTLMITEKDAEGIARFIHGVD